MNAEQEKIFNGWLKGLNTRERLESRGLTCLNPQDVRELIANILSAVPPQETGGRGLNGHHILCNFDIHKPVGQCKQCIGFYAQELGLLPGPLNSKQLSSPEKVDVERERGEPEYNEAVQAIVGNVKGCWHKGLPYEDYVVILQCVARSSYFAGAASSRRTLTDEDVDEIVRRIDAEYGTAPPRLDFAATVGCAVRDACPAPEVKLPGEEDVLDTIIRASTMQSAARNVVALFRKLNEKEEGK